MSLNVTDDQSEGDRQTSVQMTNGSKSEFFSEFSRDRGGDRRPVGGEQLVQVEEEVECTSSGVEWSGTLVRVSLVHRAHQRILSTSQKTFSSPSDALRKQTYNIFPFRAGRTAHIYMLGSGKNCV